MPDCSSFTCTTTCAGYWSGCYTYSCIDFAPVTDVANRVTISDPDGLCGHSVTRLNEYSNVWSDYGSVLRNYFEYTTVPANKTQQVYNEHIQDLRDAINEERKRRLDSGMPQWAGLVKKVWTVDITTGGVDVIAAALTELTNTINSDIQAGSLAVTPNSGTKVLSSHIDTIRKKIEDFRKSCICDTDCGSNTTCACYCDCGCNYSDERLKRNIRSL